MPSLTALKVAKAKPGRHGDGSGLYLLVSQSGARSWMIRIQVDGRRRDIGLGSTAEFTLEEARDKARSLRKVARAGGDPIAARDKEQLSPTFRQAAEACHKALSKGWKDKNAHAFLASLKLHVFPRTGTPQIDPVDEKDLVAVLSPPWTTKPAMARKLRRRLGTVLDFAKGSGCRSTGAPRHGLRLVLSASDEPAGPRRARSAATGGRCSTSIRVAARTHEDQLHPARAGRRAGDARGEGRLRAGLAVRPRRTAELQKSVLPAEQLRPAVARRREQWQKYYGTARRGNRPAAAACGGGRRR